jgi:hypothetical protein
MMLTLAALAFCVLWISGRADRPVAREAGRTIAQARPPATGLVFAPVPAEVIRQKLSLEEFLSRHDLCALSRNQVTFDRTEVSERVMKAPDLYPHGGPKDKAFSQIIGALLSPDAEHALARLRDIQDPDPAVLLYRGLLEGGLLTAMTISSPDITDAIQDLEKARALDAGNGAYAFFLAALKEQGGYPADEVRRELLRAGEAPRFESYILPLAQRVFEKGLNSAELSMLSRYLLASFPVPDYFKSEHLYSDAFEGESDPELVERALALGKHMMEPALKYGHERDGIFWMPIEYGAGNHIFKDAWFNKEGSGENLPEVYRKTHLDWMKEPGAVDPSFDVLDPGNRCSNNWLQAVYQRDKAFFQSYVAGR